MRPKFRAHNSVRRQCGFSMIELLVVIAIILTVSAMAIPYYEGYTRNYRVRNDADTIVAMLTFSRMRAGSDFAHVALNCNPAVTPAQCQVYSLTYNPSTSNPCTATWTNENRQYTLSQASSFALPTGVTTGVPSSQSTVTPVQGSASQESVSNGNLVQMTTASSTSATMSLVTSGTPANYTIIFNSRGWPVDCNGNVVSDYALYLQDQPGSFKMAIGIDASGQSMIYVYNGSKWILKE